MYFAPGRRGVKLKLVLLARQSRASIIFKLMLQRGDCESLGFRQRISDHCPVCPVYLALRSACLLRRSSPPFPATYVLQNLLTTAFMSLLVVKLYT